MRPVTLAYVIAIGVALGATAAHAQVKIVIDAGHGGTDPGGIGTGMQEKHVVLDVSKRFQALLEADTADTAGGGSWTALMTRTDDTYVSLAARSSYSNSNDADRFMCIHANAYGDTSANGTETFSYADTGTGAQLRNLVQDEMVGAWGLTNRGNKTANYAVLRDTAAPAILHELAFITNTTDAAKLSSDAERETAALAHLRALQRSYSIAPYVPGTPAQGADVSGTVVDAAGPIVGAKVDVAGGTTVVTDAQGTFTIAGAIAGAHVLTASAPGHASTTVDITVVAGVAQNDITIELDIDGSGSGHGGQGDATGGCATAGEQPGAALWIVGVVGFGALGAVRRRRRA